MSTLKKVVPLTDEDIEAGENAEKQAYETAKKQIKDPEKTKKVKDKSYTPRDIHSVKISTEAGQMTGSLWESALCPGSDYGRVLSRMENSINQVPMKFKRPPSYEEQFNNNSLDNKVVELRTKDEIKIKETTIERE